MISPSTTTPDLEEPHARLRADRVEAAPDDDGWAPLAYVGNLLTNKSPDFDPRSWGYRKLSDLIGAVGLFETDRRRMSGSNARVIYVRDRRRQSGAELAVPPDAGS